MAEERDNQPVETGKFYTSARRFKQVIGSLPDGSRIWGGPYTYTQFFLGAAMLALGLMTRGMWTRGSLLTDAVLIVGLSVGTVFLVGKIPGTRRNPLRMMAGAFKLFTQPTLGVWRGQKMKTHFTRPPEPSRGKKTKATQEEEPPAVVAAPQQSQRPVNPAVEIIGAHYGFTSTTRK